MGGGMGGGGIGPGGLMGGGMGGLGSMFGGGGGMGGLGSLGSLFGGGGGLLIWVVCSAAVAAAAGSLFSMFGGGYSAGAKIPKGFYIYETDIDSQQISQAKGGKRYYMIMGRIVKAYISQKTLDEEGLEYPFVSEAKSDSKLQLANEGQGAVVVREGRY